MKYSYVVPADVPAKIAEQFRHNYDIITKGTGRLLLFTGDHKIEHLDADFANDSLPPEVHEVEHLFRIAAHGAIGAFAIHPGLISRYGAQYPDIPYIAKLNAKTNLIPPTEHDPYSAPLATLDDITQLQRSGLSICGVGYTVYLGSIYEETMLEEAGKLIFEAHHRGLIVILWMYPRGHHVAEPHDAGMLSGAAGVGACLGADFVKLNTAHVAQQLAGTDVEHIVEAAGNSKVIFAGGPKISPQELFTHVTTYLDHGAAGIAVGRNVYQNTLDDACDVTNKLAELVYSETPHPFDTPH